MSFVSWIKGLFNKEPEWNEDKWDEVEKVNPFPAVEVQAPDTFVEPVVVLPIKPVRKTRANRGGAAATKTAQKKVATPTKKVTEIPKKPTKVVKKKTTSPTKKRGASK